MERWRFCYRTVFELAILSYAAMRRKVAFLSLMFFLRNLNGDGTMSNNFVMNVNIIELVCMEVYNDECSFFIKICKNNLK